MSPTSHPVAIFRLKLIKVIKAKCKLHKFTRNCHLQYKETVNYTYITNFIMYAPLSTTAKNSQNCRIQQKR